MRKAIAAGAIVAAAAGSLLFGAGHADAQQVCLSVSITGDFPQAPIPVALPVAPLPFQGGGCIPPDGGVPGVPTLPGLPAIP